MKIDRAMELLNEIINHVSVANSCNDTILELLAMGFNAEELISDFEFSKSDVDYALCDCKRYF